MEKTRQALKDRYRTGMYPTEADFSDVFDSYVHKNDTIEVNRVVLKAADESETPLQTLINGKAEQDTVNNIDSRLQNVEAKTGNIETIEILQNSMQSLKDRMDTVETQATRTFSYRGSVSVATINTLDTSTLVNGDVYNITDSGTIGDLSVSAGDSVCWTGSEWNVLSYTDYTDIYQRIERKLDIQQLGYPIFSPTEAYAAGDIVIHEGYMVRFLTMHTAGSWDPDETEDITLRELLAELNTATLFTMLTQVQTAQQQQALTLAQAQTSINQHTTTLGNHEGRIAELERSQGDVDLSEVYQRINEVDEKADTAISNAATAISTADSAAATANSVAQTAANAVTTANAASQTATAASTLATSLSSQVNSLTSEVESLRTDVASCVVNGGGVESARAMTLTEYDQLTIKPANTFYILTQD